MGIRLKSPAPLRTRLAPVLAFLFAISLSPPSAMASPPQPPTDPNATQSAGSPSKSHPEPGQPPPGAGRVTSKPQVIRAAELALSGVFGFGLVWLTFLKDYRKFRGLFPRLFRCSDAWCFLIIATAIVCALDVGVLLYLVYKTHLDSLVIEFYVAVVHPVLSSVSAAVLPPILHLLPQGPKVDRAFDP